MYQRILKAFHCSNYPGQQMVSKADRKLENGCKWHFRQVLRLEQKKLGHNSSRKSWGILLTFVIAVLLYAYLWKKMSPERQNFQSITFLLSTWLYKLLFDAIWGKILFLVHSFNSHEQSLRAINVTMQSRLQSVLNKTLPNLKTFFSFIIHVWHN